jgi:predicted ATPase
LAETTGSSVEKKGGSAPLGPAPARSALFARSAEYWTVGYVGATAYLKDIKGFSYIQRLLRYPGEEFHALDLLNEPGHGSAPDGAPASSLLSEQSITIGGLGDAGEMLDEHAKRDYKRRLLELREHAEDLIERGDRDQASEVESEIKFLEREIARAVGLRGRDRRAGSAAERARLNVTRAIRAALQKISDRNAALGAVLDGAIRTGSFCSYLPDLRVPISWQFSVEGLAAHDDPKPTLADDARSTSFVKRETGLLQSFTQGTTFVGREREFDILRRSLEQSLRGQGRVVLISGSPGVGKTRIAAEIGMEATNRGALMFVGNCYDREDSVPFVPFVEILEAALARAESPRSFRDYLGKDASDIARLLPELRRLFPDIPAPTENTPEQSRRALFNAFAEFLARLAGNQPVLLFFDDLHWADEGTLSLLNHLARLVLGMPILLVAAHRDFELKPARPLAKALDELIHFQFAEEIYLGRLHQTAVAAMLRALGDREVPEQLVNLIYAHTEGNPFFVEELFHHLVEQRKLFTSAGEFRLDLKAEEIDVPRSLRLVIGRRLTRLSDGAQRVLATAGIIGRSFTFRLLEASTGVEPEPLLDFVEEAERAGLINSTLEYPEAKFQFSHELVRHAVVSELSAARCQRLHLEIGHAIKRLYSEELEEHAEDLAHHLWQAGAAANPLEAARYIAIAAKQASARSANQEAIAHLKKGLEILRRAQDSPERRQLELQFQMSLGTANIFAKGYSAFEVEESFARARALSHELGENVQLFHVLRSLAAYFGVRGDYKTGFELAQQSLSLAEHLKDPLLLLAAHMELGAGMCWMGEFGQSLSHLERCLALHDSHGDQSHALALGQDLGVAYLSRMSHVLWFLGYPDKSAERSREAVALAEKACHPFSLAYARFFASVHSQLRGDAEAVREHAEAVTRLAAEQGFPTWEAGAKLMSGWALIKQGKADGITKMEEGLASWMSMGAEQALPYFLALMAEAYQTLGRTCEGISSLDHMSSVISHTGERFYEVELHRLRGELLAGQPTRSQAPETEEQIERALLKAIEVARRQEAKSMELRALVSLTRFRIGQGRGEEAKNMLAQVLQSFTEGFNSRDHQKARELLN